MKNAVRPFVSSSLHCVPELHPEQFMLKECVWSTGIELDSAVVELFFLLKWGYLADFKPFKDFVHEAKITICFLFVCFYESAVRKTLEVKLIGLPPGASV